MSEQDESGTKYQNKDTNTRTNGNGIRNSGAKTHTSTINFTNTSQAEDANYWRLRYKGLESDYNRLQQINQNLEEKLLGIVESFEKKKEELVANIEHEKSTLMADVNKLSTKLVDARIKLHDYEEKEFIHAAECDSPCHKGCANGMTQTKKIDKIQTNEDPNLV